MKKKAILSNGRLENAYPNNFGKEKYVLKLFVTGMSEKSMIAIANIKAICKEHLEGCFDLEIVDIYENSFIAEQEQIIASPSLVKKLPLPEKKLIGDLSNTKKVLSSLGIIVPDKVG